MPFEFPMRGETQSLTPALRQEVGGSFITLPDGITHYEMAGPGRRAGGSVAPRILGALFHLGSDI